MVAVLHFLGGAGTVTGSRFLVEADRARVLVDCGLFQGLKELRLRNRDPFPVDPGSIDAVVVTHAHVDHCGYLPALVRDGFNGPVYATAGTAALAGIVLPDSGRLQEEEAAFANRMGYSKHRPAVPLYTEADAQVALASLATVPFGDTVEVAPGVDARLLPAGHILGAAGVELRLRGGPTIRFSGDLGRNNHPLLRPPEPLGEADFVCVESTYGDREHDDEGALDAFCDAIVRTLERGGQVLIPAFAVDRTEVILHHLHRLVDAGRVPGVPVYVDSPMALAALRIYREAIATGSPEVRPALARAGDPFDVPDLHEVRDVEGSKAIDRLPGPAIVVSASGMVSGGRVLHHLARRLPDRRATVILVGYQAEGTRGRALVDGAREVKLLGQYVKVRAEVVDLPAFSVHADASELLDWCAGAGRTPSGAFVVHGEAAAASALARALDERLDWNAVVPRHGERVRLG